MSTPVRTSFFGRTPNIVLIVEVVASSCRVCVLWFAEAAKPFGGAG